jgi:general L-amino acid transport system substrate-binding protein
MKNILTSLAVAGTMALGSVTAVQAEGQGLLDTIIERDSLLCTGHNGSYLGFAEVDGEGEWQGFDINMNLLYQDNTSTIKLEENGKSSSG